MFVQNQKRVCHRMDGIRNINSKKAIVKRITIFGVTCGIISKNGFKSRKRQYETE